MLSLPHTIPLISPRMAINRADQKISSLGYKNKSVSSIIIN